MERRRKRKNRLDSVCSQASTSSSQPKNDYCYDFALPMVIGRKSETPFVVVIWKSISSLKSKDIRTSLGAIKSEVNNNYPKYSRKFDADLRNCVSDKLIVEKKANGVTVFDVPNEKDTPLSHEMNCYTCFFSGEEMWECKNCNRVYHDQCYSYSDIKGKCYYCAPHFQAPIREKTMDKTGINDLLSIMYHKIGLPNGYLDVIRCSNLDKERETIGHLLPKLLLRPNVTNLTIKSKLENHEYKSIRECVCDYRQIVFNLCVIYGPNSENGKRAQEMFTFILSEASYMHNCFDCYVYYAQDKKLDKNNIWFLMPCNPPHEIVFAKYKSCEPSPAKIIRSDKDQSYVWFFGGHEVAWIHKDNLSPCLTVKEPISQKLKLALIEMEKYKLVISRYKDGKINFKGIPRLKKQSNCEVDSDSD